MRRILMVLGCLSLTGCSTEGLIQSAYPDRSILEFPTTDRLSVFSYACARGESNQQTIARATEAHSFVETNLNASADVFADQIIDGIENDAGAISTSILAARTINQNSQLIVDQAEERYQCLFFDERDA